MSKNEYKLAHTALARAADFVDQDHFNELDVEQAKLRLDTINEHFAAFKDCHGKLFPSAEGDHVAKFIDTMEKAEANYFKAASAFKKKIILLEPPPTQIVQNPVEERQINVQVNVPLRHDELFRTIGKFNGEDLTLWPAFRDRFTEAVHSDNDTKPAFKFQYLQLLLESPAADVCSGLLSTQEGYDQAWKRLNDVYGKSYPLRRAHLRKFFCLPELQGQPTGEELQRMVNVTHETTRQLKAQKVPVEHWDFLFVHWLHERLDSETARRWELQRNSDEPTVVQMLDFLEKQAAALKGSDLQRKCKEVKIKLANKLQPRPEPSASSQVSGQPKNPLGTCMICKGNHQIWTCSEFMSLSISGRKDFVDQNPICANCLKFGHKKENCFQRPCIRCPGEPFHNRLLCPNIEVNRQGLAHRVTDADSMALVRRIKDNEHQKKED